MPDPTHELLRSEQLLAAMLELSEDAYLSILWMERLIAGVRERKRCTAIARTRW